MKSECSIACNGSGIADVNTETFFKTKFENMKLNIIILLQCIVLAKLSKGTTMEDVWSIVGLVYLITSLYKLFVLKNEGSVNGGKSLQDE